jgi:hypothetical protein
MMNGLVDSISQPLPRWAVKKRLTHQGPNKAG